jgi:hypothetical protein
MSLIQFAASSLTPAFDRLPSTRMVLAVSMVFILQADVLIANNMIAKYLNGTSYVF